MKEPVRMLQLVQRKVKEQRHIQGIRDSEMNIQIEAYQRYPREQLIFYVYGSFPLSPLFYNH